MKIRSITINHRPSPISHSSDDRGVALILTLAILALVTLLLIAFVTSMRVENAASKNYNSLIKARELVKGAVDQAVAQIRAATPLRSDGTPATYYVTFPGGTYVYNGAVATPNPLYSDPNLGDPTNLNSGLWITGGTNNSGEFHPNTPNATQINVGWIYVAQDGTVGVPSQVAGHGALIGRFAYWVDDEASKININTAGVPPGCNDSPYNACSTSSNVDLSVLEDGLGPAQSVVSARSPNPFTTIEEIKRIIPTGIAPDVFDDNRFEVTTYSNDANYPSYLDDLDIFDRPRQLLNFGSLSANFATVVSELSDPNLATAFGSSGNAFATKYGNVKQLVANIIGYQIDPTITAPPTDGAIPPAAYLALAKTPYINQIQIKYVVTPRQPPASSTVTRTISVTLLYIYNGSYNSRGETIAITGLPTAGGLFQSSVTISVPAAAITGVPGTGVPYTPPPHTDSKQFTGNLPIENATPLITYNRTYLLDYARPKLLRNQISSIGGLTTVYQGAQVVGDPAVHESVANEWTPYTTLPAPNPNYPGGNDVSKVLMRAAPMQSVGELGYIHLPGVAYGHLTLQPGGGSSSGQIPDWAMLDLFTVGAGGAGRININSVINPINQGQTGPTSKRTVPLTALLNSLNGWIIPTTVAPNIDSRTYRTIGEICEIGSLIPANASKQADMEQTIRRIANLITVRSNTFTIWALAQSIKQPPTTPSPGTFNANYDVITGEAKAQAVVERYENPPGAGTTPEFRLRYFRYLYN
jgi:hypothetical protein